jgi:tripartite-type tricarboxylate transporter receptor subunit TctC
MDRIEPATSMAKHPQSGKPVPNAYIETFVMDHKPGAGGTIGTAPVSRAPTDGYTIMISTTAPLISANAGSS